MSAMDTTKGSALPAGVSEGYRSWVLGILFVVYTFNFIDRQILSILVEPIKAELELSDTQMGFLTGFAFAIFYSTLGIPIAALADRYSRRNILSICLAVWSGMTAVCAFAGNFWQLAAARVGVAIGEAGGSPPSHSLISDYYPPEKRATALAIYSLGIPVGTLFGFLIGGWVAEIWGWRTAFLAVGIPGVLLAIVVRLAVREPERGAMDAQKADDNAPSIGEVARYLWAKRGFRHLSMAAALSGFIGYGIVAWFPAFLIRTHGMTVAEVGTALSLIIGIAGGVGTFMGGMIADRLATRDKRWYAWMLALAAVLPLPLAVGVYFADTAFWALALYVIPVIVGSFWYGPTFALVQSMAGSRMRAMATAILFLILNLIGLGMGPQAIGLLSDALKPEFGTDSLRYALMVLAFVALWAGYHFWAAGKTLVKDLGLEESA